MKVQIHTYDAEMGRTSGGVFNMTAKSGANVWAGSAYTVLRPGSLATQFYMDELRGKPKIVETWHNFGGGVGGPIKKNKTFFWLAGERYTQGQPGTRSVLVPTMAERNGDFSKLTRNGVLKVIKDPITKLPFTNNIIPADRINPVGKKYASYFDSPILRVVLDTAGHHPSLDEAVALLAPWRDELERAHVCLAIENHDRFTAKQFRDLVARLNSPCVGICLDTGNSWLGGSEHESRGRI